MTLEGWLFNLCDSEAPKKSIIAYNFGLFETEDSYSIYLIGSNEFDENDSDWATNSDFEPKDKYFQLPAKDFKKLSWQQVLDQIESELKTFSKSAKFRNSFFSKAQAVTTGFDDGDLVRIV
jgi:hypothetical protein